MNTLELAASEATCGIETPLDEFKLAEEAEGYEEMEKEHLTKVHNKTQELMQLGKDCYPYGILSSTQGITFFNIFEALVNLPESHQEEIHNWWLKGLQSPEHQAEAFKRLDMYVREYWYEEASMQAEAIVV